MEQNNKIKVPKIAYIFFGITILSIIIYIIAITNVAFADFFNRYISSAFRAILATVTNILPISFAELLIICSPIILFFVIRFAIKKYSKSWNDVGIFCILILCIISLLFSAFVFTFGTGYHTYDLGIKLELDKKEVSQVV